MDETFKILFGLAQIIVSLFVSLFLIMALALLQVVLEAAISWFKK